MPPKVDRAPTAMLLTMVQVLYLLDVFILAHSYGPPSTEIPTTETTIVQCHKTVEFI